MRGCCLIVVVLAAVAGCGKESKFEGPMPVTLGDCAGPATAWQSGPKAAPFLPAEAKDVQPFSELALADPPPPELEAASQDDPPPPEEEDKPDDGKEETGGTGTAMALEEGKMGKEDPQLARQQA